MKKTLWKAAVLGSGLFVLSACGAGVEPERELSQVRMSQEPDGAPDGQDGVEALAGRGHGCPRQGSECRSYCKGKGHTSGGCSGYGGGSCVCRDADPAP